MLTDTRSGARKPFVWHRLGESQGSISVDHRSRVLQTVAAFGEQSERSGDPKNLEPEYKKIPDEQRKKQIDQRSRNTFAQELPGVGDAAIARIRRSVFENMLGLPRHELIEPSVQSGKEIGTVS